MLWEEFRSLPFPPELHEDKYDHLELESTDAAVAGCISSYLAVGGELDKLEQTKVEILKDFVSKYSKIDFEISESESGKVYFSKLKKLADLIVGIELA